MEVSLFTIESQPICEETKAIAINELRETPDNISRGLKELRELLAKDSTINSCTDDDFLTLFLRPCKYYPQSAYKLMKGIAEFRARYSSILEHLYPEHEKEAFTNHDLLNIMVNRDQKGRRVVLVKTGSNWDPSKVTIDQILRMLYLLHLAALLEPKTQVRGIVVVMDVKDLGWKQVKAFSPSFARKLTQFIQEAFPLRLKEFHIVNNPAIFKLVWQIVRPLIHEKLHKRIFFHQYNMASLHMFLDPEVLPEDYGGHREKIWYSGRDWYPAIEDHIDFIKKWNSFGKIV